MICISDDMIFRTPRNRKYVSYNHAEPAQHLNDMIIRYTLDFIKSKVLPIYILFTIMFKIYRISDMNMSHIKIDVNHRKTKFPTILVNFNIINTLFDQYFHITLRFWFIFSHFGPF